MNTEEPRRELLASLDDRCHITKDNNQRQILLQSDLLSLKADRMGLEFDCEDGDDGGMY